METTSKTDTSLNTSPNADAPLATYKLRRPFEINGKRVTELILDMDALSADDILSVQDEHAALLKSNPAHTRARLPFMYVARMNGMIVGDLTARLKGNDVSAVLDTVGGFFSGTGS
jgi:hypothetical protein